MAVKSSYKRKHLGLKGSSLKEFRLGEESTTILDPNLTERRVILTMIKRYMNNVPYFLKFIHFKETTIIKFNAIIIREEPVNIIDQCLSYNTAIARYLHIHNCDKQEC